MEAWRIIATALFGAAGIALTLIVMAQVRERSESASQTAISGAVGTAAGMVLAVLMLTVLAPALTWALVVLAGISVTVMVLAS